MAVAGPSSLPVASPTVTTGLGEAPRDGDFARLLEAASTPGAHRLEAHLPIGVPGAVPAGRAAAGRRAAAAQFGRRAGAPGAAGADASTAGRAGAGDALVETAGGAPVQRRGGSRPPAAASGRSSAAGAPGRSIRDRVVAVLFVVAGLWIVGAFVAALRDSPGDDLGALLVLALIAFAVLRGWSRARRRPPPTP